VKGVKGGGGGRFDGLVLGWTLDTGRWMLERLKASWPPGLLASWPPGFPSSRPMPAIATQSQGPPRPTAAHQ